MNGKTVIYLSPEEFPGVPLVMDGVSTRFVRENGVIPFEWKDGTLKIIMADPSNREIVDALRVATASDVLVYTGDPAVIDEHISRFYSKDQQNVDKIIEGIDEREGYEFIRDEEEEDVGHLKDLASEAPIIRLVNLFITRAVESRASDIHIEPFEDEMKIRYRIDGVLNDVESAPKRLQAAIVSRIKIMARLNIAERRLPQDGRIRLRVGEKEIAIRVSTIPILNGESIVMRILDRESIVIDLDRLGFSRAMLTSLDRLITKPNGIILVTGPTGSGKTTTLYGALDKINSPEKKIITVEDPVEYQLKGVNQIQVKPRIGLDFNSTLRHIVRQDPDIIMIGEIRDLETAQIAIQSALTGHLVFSTLHTNDAPSAITRLLDMGVESFLLSSTVRGILAQRLVRMICPDCRRQAGISDEVEELMALGIDSGVPIWRGAGCEICGHTGFFGRSGLFELLVIDEDVRRLTLKGADEGEIRAQARRSGMKTLLEDGIEKIRMGITTLDEVFRVTRED